MPRPNPLASVLRGLAVAAAACCLAARAVAGDWPRYRGERQDGTSAERITVWPPRELWRTQVKAGFSQVVVRAGRAYTMGYEDGRNHLFCLDAATGERLWTVDYPNPGVGGYEGVRATPTLADDHLYTFSQTGRLDCFMAADGRHVWTRQLASPAPNYHYSSSPLVLGELVIVNAGTSGTAVRRRTGELVWGDDGGKGGHASPVPCGDLILIGGGKDATLAGVDPATGARRFWVSWGNCTGVRADPIVLDGKVFVSYYLQGSAVYPAAVRGQLDWKTDAAWARLDYTPNVGNGAPDCLFAKVATPVLRDGHLYGVSDLQAEGDGARAVVKCVEFASGRMKWRSDPGLVQADANLTLVGDEILVVNSWKQELLALAASPEGVRETRPRVGKLWPGGHYSATAPTVAQGRLYLRSAAGTVICYQIGAEAR